jgi:hypothetical protein
MASLMVSTMRGVAVAQAGFPFDPDEGVSTVIRRLKQWPSRRLPCLTTADACRLAMASVMHSKALEPSMEELEQELDLCGFSAP